MGGDYRAPRRETMLNHAEKRRQAGRSPNAPRQPMRDRIREAFGLRRACSRFLDSARRAPGYRKIKTRINVPKAMRYHPNRLKVWLRT